MFGREERDEFDAGRFVQHVDRLPSFAVASGVIRDQTDSHARKLFEVISLEHVDAGQHFRRAAGSFVTKGKLSQALRRPRRNSSQTARARSTATVSVTEPATIEATRPRNGPTSPLPSGCTRLLRNTTNISLAGSIQIDVPVKPV